MLSSKLVKKRSNQIISLDDRIIQIEAKLGGLLFQSNNKNAKYKFYCLNEYVWILSKNTDSLSQTFIKYHIYDNQIYKQVYGINDWQQLSLLEIQNLKTAIKLYRSRVLTKLYPNCAWLSPAEPED